jgi:DNA-binding response OmpR family regulator
VLVIDDDPSIRQLLRTLLEAQDYDVRAAADGAEGLRSVATAMPDCVLLDLMMPGLHGFQVLQQIRARRDGGQALVVMLTAASDDEHARQAWRSSVDYFLGKPFDIQVLLSYLAAHLPTHDRVTQGRGTHDDHEESSWRPSPRLTATSPGTPGRWPWQRTSTSSPPSSASRPITAPSFAGARRP